MINLSKGTKINLSKDVPGLSKVRFGLGWKANPTDTGSAFDLDASAFGLKFDAKGEPKLAGNDADFFVFYNNACSVDNAIVHAGDNRTGAGDGDDESITVDLKMLSPTIDEISFIVTIHEALERKQNFGQVSKSYISVYDDATGAVLAKYDLEDDFSAETAVQFGSLYKKDGNWSFKAIGAGYKLGLDAFVTGYGGQVA